MKDELVAATKATSWVEDHAKLMEILDLTLADEMTDPDEVAKAILAAGFHTR